MFNEDDADFVALLHQHHFEGQTDIGEGSESEAGEEANKEGSDVEWPHSEVI